MMAFSGVPPKPSKWPIAGMTFTGGRYCPNVSMGSAEATSSLHHLRSTGANWVSLVVTQYQWNITSTDIFPLFNGSEVVDVTSAYYDFVTLEDAELAAGIRTAKSLGFRVMLKPHVDLLRNEHPSGAFWRGDIGGCPASVTSLSEREWLRWFASYEQFIVHYAEVAEAHGVDMLSLGCELTCANARAAQWRQVAARVRRSFSGILTTSSMPPLAGSPVGHSKECGGQIHGEPPAPVGAPELAWWDAVDVIGLDAYWLLNGSTSGDLVAQWKPHVAYARALARQHGKRLIFTEIGYCSGRCERTHTPSATDYESQAAHYSAVFEAMRGEESWFDGAFWWNWNTDDGANDGDDFLSPQWKPAEDVLRAYYRAVQPKPPAPAQGAVCMGAGKGTC